jgi:hypothetical protein
VIKLEAGDWAQVQNNGQESIATRQESPHGFPLFLERYGQEEFR